MFALPRTSSHRQRSASHSTDDQSIHQNPRKLFQRYVHDLSMSSQSLATTNSQLDDLHIPSPPTLPLHSHQPASAPSTPTTSPSTAYSSLFPGSLSSATSESMPSTDPYYRSELGVLTPGSHSPISSRSSNPPWSRSPNEPDTQPSALREFPSSRLSQRPSTAPHFSPSSVSPAAAAGSSSTADNGQPQIPTDRHTRSHSRLTVTIKNLLSKPAIPSPSRFSFKSTTLTTMRSESDTLSSPSDVPSRSSKWPTTTTPRKSRPLPPDLEITDVHRRYTNEASSKPCEVHTGYGSSTSPETVAVSSTPNAHTPSPAVIRGREPRQRNVLRRRPSGSAKLVKGRERGISSTCQPYNLDPDRIRLPLKGNTSHHQGGPSSSLTPASAVAEAYKQQQELRRDDPASPTKLSMDNQGSSTASHDGGVYDRKSRIEAVERGPLWTTDTGTTTPQLAPSISDSVGRSLTRKVSARWRKLKGGEADVTTRVSEDSPSRNRERGHSKGRPSLQEMWKGSSVRSTGRSMDDVPNVNAGDSARASPVAGRQHERSGSGCDKVLDEGSKLWRLMRRISTGGLRDRFQVEKEKEKVTTVPPVPAIPKELLDKANQGRGKRGGSEQPLSTTAPRHPLVLKNDVTNSNVIITPTRPSVATSSSVRSSDVSSSPFFSKTHSARSSVSSYGEALGGSSVLDRHIISPLEQLRLGDGHGQCDEPSTLSTVAVPALPRSPRRSPSVPACLRRAEDVEDRDDRGPFPSPSSSRRQTCSGESPSSSRGSWRASSSSASASGSPNHASYHHQTYGLSSLSPPPPPRKLSRSLGRGRGRGAGGSVTSLPSSSSPSTFPSHLHSRSVVVGRQADGGVRQMERMPSAQSNMTARGGDSKTEPGQLRLRVPERGTGGDEAHSSPHTTTGTQFTFRELPLGGLARRPPLSEQEKADIWDDLLARSDQAGGTLHIYGGAPELMSDTLRFSMCSDA